MARQYITIDSVRDIDLSQINLQNINDRYIDSEGKRWATRFKLRTRKIQVVRIALGTDEAIQAKMNKASASEGDNATLNADMDLPDWINAYGIHPDNSVHVNSFLNNIDGETNKISERIRGIISNFNNAEILEAAESTTGQDFSLQITSMFDREVQEHLSKTQSLVMEFNRFPKPPSNYFMHLSRKKKKIIEDWPEEKQMEFFKAFMIGEAYLAAIGGALSLLKLIQEQTKKLSPNAVPHEKKSFYEAGKEAMVIVEETLLSEAERVLGWMEIADVLQVS